MDRTKCISMHVFLIYFVISTYLISASGAADPAAESVLENGTTGYLNSDETITGPLSSSDAPVIKIMPLGDSITSSSNSYRNRLWYLLADKGINADFVGSLSKGYQILPDKDHEGHGGWRIDQISVRVEKWLSKYTPDIVLLHIGTNDISQNYYLETAPDRFGALLDRITSKSSARVIAASIIPRRTDNNATIAYNNAIRSVVYDRQSQGKNIYFVDLFNEAGIDPRKDLSDRVHPNIRGSNKIADAWFRQIEIVLSQQDQPAMGYINGTVKDGTLAISGVYVSTASTGNFTDQDGRYSLKVAAGTYAIHAAKQPQYYDNRVADINVTWNNTTELNIELLEKPTGIITGTVTER